MITEARRWIGEYLTALDAVRSQTLESCPELGGDLSQIVRLVRLRTWEKVGELTRGIEYRVHGDGCLFVLEGGYEVDVDFVDGMETFDSWRIWKFVQSVTGQNDLTVDEIAYECSRLAREGGIRRLRDGWYIPA